MKKIFSIFIFLLVLGSSVQAQIGIGTTSPDASAALEVSATDKGFLMPRMTTVQREGIASPAEGLMVFDTDTDSQWTYFGGAWGETKAGVGKFIDGASADIAYYEGKVGIGINSFGDALKLNVESTKDTDGSHTSAAFNAIYTGSGTAFTGYAMAGRTRNEGTGTIGYGIGSQGIIENNNPGGSYTTAVGTYPQVYNKGSMNYTSGAISEIYNDGTIVYGSGLAATVNNNSGSMNTARAMDLGVENASGATLGTTSLASMYATNNGAVSNDAYGLFIGGQGSGTVGGNAYALYLSTPYNNVTGTSYALYSDNTNVSYVEGNLGVGTNDPQQKVHVSGVLRLEPQATAPTGGLGDMYVGTDNKLYFHDGTSWKEVQLVP